MKNCENCIYWKIQKSATINGKNFNACSKIKDLFSYMDNPYDSKLDKSAKDIKAFTEDAERYYSALITRKDFYCILWND